MSKDFVIESTLRTDEGKGASRRLRRLENKIPAVVYGAGEPAQSLSIDHNDIFHALEDDRFYSSLIQLKIDGKETDRVILKALQRHPYKSKIVHADFQRVPKGVAMKFTVPVVVSGEETCPGVRNGGVLSLLESQLEISCLPRNLPEQLDIDVSALELDGVYHISDLTLPEGVELMLGEGAVAEEMPLISVKVPKVIVDVEQEVADEDAEGDDAQAAAEGETEAKDSSDETKAEGSDESKGEA